MALSIFVLAWAVTAGAVGGQSPPIRVRDGLVPVVPAVPSDVRIALLEERLASDPRHYDSRWQAAAEYALLGIGEPDRNAQRELWRRAQAHALAATEANPDGVDGHYWRATVAGMLADVTGGMEKIRLGDEAYRESSWVLERDTLHAGAHYLQGRIHASVMRLNGFLRFLAKLLVGGEALDGASWEKAEYHLRRAAELQPELAMHHFELAAAYESLGRREEMVRALGDAATASQESPYQEEYKERARRSLEALPDR